MLFPNIVIGTPGRLKDILDYSKSIDF